MKILDSSTHISSPDNYSRAGNYKSDQAQPTSDKPLTCREREYLLDEIDYWQRAYYVACDRRQKDKRDNKERHQRVADILLVISFSVIALIGTLWMFKEFVDWMMYGWR